MGVQRKKRCETCAAWNRRDSWRQTAPGGICRRSAPVPMGAYEVHEDSDGRLLAVKKPAERTTYKQVEWPATTAFDWCLEWMPQDKNP